MAYVGDPPADTMSDRIEQKIRLLLRTSSDFDSIKVFYRGEPGFVPVKLFPMVVTFLTEQQEATGQDGFGDSTGLRYYRYVGYVALEVLMKDTSGLMPDANREANVPSYLAAKDLTQAAFNAVVSWGGPQGNLEQNPVISYDTKEETVELRTGVINNGLARRGDNVTNRGTLNFTVYTRRQDW